MMYKLIFTTVCIALCSRLTSAASFREIDLGECPEFTVKTDFDAGQYLGTWFENHRIFAGFERDQQCVQAQYQLIGEGRISVKNTASLPNGDAVSIEGTADLVKPGVLIVHFPGSPPGDYNVLDTDYTSFSCVYSCNVVLGVRAQYAWILTRESVISQELEDKAFEVFKRNGVDVSLFEKTYQADDCNYV